MLSRGQILIYTGNPTGYPTNAKMDAKYLKINAGYVDVQDILLTGYLLPDIGIFEYKNKKSNEKFKILNIQPNKPNIQVAGSAGYPVVVYW